MNIKHTQAQQHLHTQVKQCINRYGYDVRYLTTQYAIDDLELIRRELGFLNWHLFGVSYGTRVALEYLRQYPEGVKSVVLDSVLYPEHSLGEIAGDLSEKSLFSLFNLCEKNKDCHHAFPNIKDKFSVLFDSLKSKPVVVHYEDFVSAEKKQILFSAYHLSMVVRMALYQNESSSKLPLLISEAVKGNFLPLVRQFDLMKKNLSDAISIGMHYSVICQEDFPFINKKISNRDKYFSEFITENYLSSTSDICAAWPKGKISHDFKLPVHTDIPVLLLSGSEDPITPPYFAEKAAANLLNSQHIVVEGQGHNVSPLGCIPRMVAHFFETSVVLSESETACLSRIYRAPFFIDFNGPRP